MTCPICFFRDSYQRSLKVTTFGISRFESKLEKYKYLYVGELNNLERLKDCSCYKTYSNESLCLWADEFLLDIHQHIDQIESTFDRINLSYRKFISENQRSSINSLYGFLEESLLIDRTVDSSELVRTMFRARLKGKFSPTDIKEFFHVPFSKRHLVGSQRFSIPGLPLLYLGSSTLTVEKELEANSSYDLEYSAFLPSYSHFYRAKIFNLTNNMNDLLEKNLPGIMDGGGHYPYSGDGGYSYKPKFLREIQANILLQICTFPTECKKSFIPEYVIPQMLTIALQEKQFDGLCFPSTKCFASLKDNHRFASHHLNFVLFTEYSPDCDFDSSLLDRFYTFTLGKKRNISKKEVLDAIELVCELNRRSEVNNNDFVMPLVRAKLQIEYLENSSIESVKYFDSDTGKTELSLYLDMANEMFNLVSKRLR
ncbi:hypothetical protein J6J08_10065 [Pseudidiomarina sp. 1APR75-33.1]|uniref:hypothetical protein n=1 Tax=Pseudidiomarina terrestris TaxID=2820060 RepID=UPI00265324DF|nr:hypothetical protein [Pseudidiomarina sp. 1APR75-33.1]MDN7127724.1 hypothetical protein [Pseudidiomarina sp. 1APR75-33.1]